jgi:hypothetical protein
MPNSWLERMVAPALRGSGVSGPQGRGVHRPDEEVVQPHQPACGSHSSGATIQAAEDSEQGSRGLQRCMRPRIHTDIQCCTQAQM